MGQVLVDPVEIAGEQFSLSSSSLFQGIGES